MAKSKSTNRPVSTRASIYSYASEGPLQHSSNNYFVETSDGVFVIDAQWTLSEAHRSLKQLRTITDKPIIGLFITHDHTDHYGGTPAIAEGASQHLPVYSSQLTALSIRNDAWGFQQNRKRNFGEDFPDQPFVPDRIVKDRQMLSFGSLSLHILERHNNECTCTSMIYVEELDALIAGDMVYDRTYAIFREGLSGLENWKRQLEGLREDFPDATIYPGHGQPQPARQIIDEQIRFLLAFRDPILFALERHGKITPSALDNIKNDLFQEFPSHRSIIGLSKEQVIEQSVRWLSEDFSRS